jgi:hypothetical protein
MRYVHSQTSNKHPSACPNKAFAARTIPSQNLETVAEYSQSLLRALFDNYPSNLPSEVSFLVGRTAVRPVPPLENVKELIRVVGRPYIRRVI